MSNQDETTTISGGTKMSDQDKATTTSGGTKMNDQDKTTTISGGTIGRIIAAVAVVVAFVALIFISNLQNQAANPSVASQIWDEQMVVGPEDATTLYVMYTDLLCPYCDVFSRAALENWDEFLAFLNENSVRFELRLTDILYASSGSTMSRDSAEAAYCAKREGKFWEYYHGAIQALWDDYQSKGIASNKTAPAITNLPDDYWQAIGHQVGLGSEFDQCVLTGATASEVTAVTTKALKESDGLPTFRFGKFSTSGFSDTWDWTYVKRYLEAGLGKS